MADRTSAEQQLSSGYLKRVRCAALAVDVLAPLFGLGEAFEQMKAAKHEPRMCGATMTPAVSGPPTDGFHGEANFVLEQRAFGGFSEVMVVLEALESSGDHTVLKEVRRVPGRGR